MKLTPIVVVFTLLLGDVRTQQQQSAPGLPDISHTFNDLFNAPLAAGTKTMSNLISQGTNSFKAFADMGSGLMSSFMSPMQNMAGGKVPGASASASANAGGPPPAAKNPLEDLISSLSRSNPLGSAINQLSHNPLTDLIGNLGNMRPVQQQAPVAPASGIAQAPSSSATTAAAASASASSSAAAPAPASTTVSVTATSSSAARPVAPAPVASSAAAAAASTSAASAMPAPQTIIAMPTVFTVPAIPVASSASSSSASSAASAASAASATAAAASAAHAASARSAASAAAAASAARAATAASTTSNAQSAATASAAAAAAAAPPPPPSPPAPVASSAAAAAVTPLYTPPAPVAAPAAAAAAAASATAATPVRHGPARPTGSAAAAASASAASAAAASDTAVSTSTVSTTSVSTAKSKIKAKARSSASAASAASASAAPAPVAPPQPAPIPALPKDAGTTEDNQDQYETIEEVIDDGPSKRRRRSVGGLEEDAEQLERVLPITKVDGMFGYAQTHQPPLGQHGSSSSSSMSSSTSSTTSSTSSTSTAASNSLSTAASSDLGSTSQSSIAHKASPLDLLNPFGPNPLTNLVGKISSAIMPQTHRVNENAVSQDRENLLVNSNLKHIAPVVNYDQQIVGSVATASSKGHLAPQASADLATAKSDSLSSSYIPHGTSTMTVDIKFPAMAPKSTTSSSSVASSASTSSSTASALSASSSRSTTSTSSSSSPSSFSSTSAAATSPTFAPSPLASASASAASASTSTTTTSTSAESPAASVATSLSLSPTIATAPALASSVALTSTSTSASTTTSSSPTLASETIATSISDSSLSPPSSASASTPTSSTSVASSTSASAATSSSVSSSSATGGIPLSAVVNTPLNDLSAVTNSNPILQAPVTGYPDVSTFDDIDHPTEATHQIASMMGIENDRIRKSIHPYSRLAAAYGAENIQLALPRQTVSIETPLEQLAGEAFVGFGESRSSPLLSEDQISQLQIPVESMDPMEPMEPMEPMYSGGSGLVPMHRTFDAVTKQILSGREVSDYDQYRLSDSSRPSQALQDGFELWNRANPLPGLRDNQVFQAEKPIIVDSMNYQTDAIVYDSVNSAEPQLIRFDYGPFIQRKILFPRNIVN